MAGRNGPAELVKRAHFLRVAVSPTGPCSDLSPPAPAGGMSAEELALHSCTR